MAERTRVTVGDRELLLSNLDKVLYPAVGFAKAAVIDYYARIAPVMLPHLRGRPLTTVRWPNGVMGERFFEKRCPSHRPPWIETGGKEGNCLLDEPAALVWTANLAALELHVPQALAHEPDRPTAVVIDLDPGPPATIIDCCRVAITMRAALAQLGLTVLAKTSGGKGLHLSIPLNTPTTAAATKRFARALGTLLAESDQSVLVDMNRERRQGKVFVDWSQNDAAKTTVCVYSLRGRELPTVSTPITWDEVEAGAESSDPDRLVFETGDTLERVDAFGDLWIDALTLRQDLPEL